MWIAVAVVLGLAAVGKGRDVRRFAAEIDGYRLWPAAGSSAGSWVRASASSGSPVGRARGPVLRVEPLAVAVAVVAAEAGAAVLVAVPVTRVLGAAVAAALFAAFTAAAASVLARGVVTRCGCFGGRGDLDLVGPPTVVRAASLLVVALLAAVAPTASPVVDVATAAVVLALVLVLSEIARLVTLPARRDPVPVSVLARRSP